MLVATIGSESSGSTWLYNVVRRIVQAAGGTVYSLQATAPVDLQKVVEFEGRFVFANKGERIISADSIVTKGHNIQPELLSILRAAHGKFVLSIRDPRDSIASLLLRLGSSPSDGAVNLARSLSSIFTVRATCSSLCLTYESRFFEKVETLDNIVDYLEVEVPRSTLQTIHAEFERESVSQLIERMKSQQSASRDKLGGWVYDDDTQFNENHLGDGLSGKWETALPSAYKHAVDRAFGAIAEATFLDSSFVMRFPECLFVTTPCPPGERYFPRVEDGLWCAIQRAWLPRGRWRVVVRGGIDHAGPITAYLAQDGQRLYATLIEDRDLHNFLFTCEVEIRVYASALHLSFEGEGQWLPVNPFRQDAIEIEARYISAL